MPRWKPRPEDGDFWAHRALYLAQNFDSAAIETAEKAVALETKDDWGRHVLSAALTRAGRLDEAEAVIRAFVESHPEDAQGYWQLSLTLGEQGQTVEALEAIERVLEIGYGNSTSQAMARKAAILSTLDRDDEAARCLQEALALREGSCSLHRTRAQILLKGADYEGAIQAAAEALRWNSQDIGSRQLRGLAHFNMRDYAAALPDLEAAAAAYPLHGDTQSYLAQAFDALGRRAEAAKQYYRTMELIDGLEDPENLYSLLVLNAWGRGEHEEALSVLEGALARLPENLQLPALQVNLLRQLGRREEAIAAAEQLIERAGPHALALSLISITALELGQTDRARVAAERLLALNGDPQYGPPAVAAQGLGSLARIHLVEGGVAEALAKLDKALAIKLPGSEHFAWELHNLRFEVLIELERYDEAILELDAVEAASPIGQKPHRPQLLAWIELLRERSDEVALDLTAKLVAAYPDHMPALHLHAHQVARTQGADAAVQVIEKALERWPDQPTLVYRRGWWNAVAGRVSEGLADFDAALRQFPPPRPVMMRHGRMQVLAMLGRYEDVLQVAEAFHDGHGYRMAREGMAFRAFALASLGRSAEAHVQLDALRKRWPTSPFLCTVEACLRMGEFDRAVEEAEFLAKDKATRAPIRVRALRAAGRLDEAKDIAWEFAGRELPVEKTPGRAYLAAAAGSPDRARALLEASRPSESVDDCLDCARACFVLGDEEAARSWVDKAKKAGWKLNPGVAPDPDLPR